MLHFRIRMGSGDDFDVRVCGAGAQDDLAGFEGVGDGNDNRAAAAGLVSAKVFSLAALPGNSVDPIDRALANLLSPSSTTRNGALPS